MSLSFAQAPFSMGIGGYVSIGNNIQITVVITNQQNGVLTTEITAVALTTPAYKTIRTKVVSANSVDTIQLLLPRANVIKFVALGNSNVRGVITDSRLEMTVDLTVLPVKLSGAPKIELVGTPENPQFKVTFQVLSVTGDGRCNIKLSTDGIHFKLRGVVFADGPGTYSITIPL